jgi:hypothetical protein
MPIRGHHAKSLLHRAFPFQRVDRTNLVACATMISQLWSRCDDRQNAAPPLNETIRAAEKTGGVLDGYFHSRAGRPDLRFVQALEYAIVGIKQSILSNLIVPLRQDDLCWGLARKKFCKR